jgi:HK97 family phage portal protein
MPTWTHRVKSGLAALFANTNATAGVGGDPFGWLLSGTSRSPMARTSVDILTAYGTMPWLRAVTHRVATSIAAVPWTLSVPSRRPRSGGDGRVHTGEGEPLESHPLLDLLSNGNPLIGAQASRQMTQLCLDLVGESFWLLERNGVGMPIAFWPMPPSWITDLPTASLPYFRIAYRTVQAMVPVTEILWFKDIHPLDPYGHGRGTAQALSDELETDEYAAKHTKAWFYNSARPDIIVTADNLSKEDTARLEQDWNSKNKGFLNAFKAYFLNRKVDVTTLSQSFSDQQLIELRQWERDMIIQIYGVPPEMMGIIEHSNRATITESMTIFSTCVLIPRLELLRDTMQRLLVPQFDDRLILGYVSPIPDDREYQLSVMKAAPQAFLVDQWQQAAGFPDLPDGVGQNFYVPVTSTTTNNLDLPDQTQPPLQGNPGPKEPDKALPTAAPVAPRKATPARVTKRDSADAITTLALQLEPEAREAFLGLMAGLSDQTPPEALEAAISTGNAQTVLDMIPWGQLGDQAPRFTDLLTQALDRAGATEAALLSQELGLTVSWNLASAHAVQASQQISTSLMTDLTATSQTAIRGVIEQGLLVGTPTPELATQIRQVLGLNAQQAQAVQRFRADLQAQGLDGATVAARVAKYAEAQLNLRSMVVARTSIQEALNMGIQASWNQAIAAGHLTPSEWRKTWEVTPDDRLCLKICEPLPHMPENQNVPIQGTFTTPDGRQLLTPPAHPLCRCIPTLRRL